MGSTDPYGLVGATLSGRYSVETFAGVGRFTAVYRGTQLDTLLPVALKLLRVRQDLTGFARPKILATLDSTTRVAADIANLCPSFCEVKEVASIITADGRWMPFIAEAWVDGVTLEEVLGAERTRTAPLRSLGEAMDLLSPVGDALAYAHSRSVVHGSFAPRTLFVKNDDLDLGMIEVVDLGLADAIDALQREHRAFLADETPTIGFAPSHAAPEQIARRFGPTGPWTDVFALALVLTELLTGMPALGDGDDAQLADASLDPVRRPTPRNLGRNVGHYVESVFERALAVRPQERYSTVAAFWDALRSASRIEYPRTSPSYVPPPPVQAKELEITPVAPPPRSSFVPPPLPHVAQRPSAPPLSFAPPPSQPAPSSRRRSLPPPLPHTGQLPRQLAELAAASPLQLPPTLDAMESVIDSEPPPRSTLTPPEGIANPHFLQPVTAVARSTPPSAEIENDVRPPPSSRPRFSSPPRAMMETVPPESYTPRKLVRKRTYAALAGTFAAGLLAGIAIFAYEETSHDAPIHVASSPSAPAAIKSAHLASGPAVATKPAECPQGMVRVDAGDFTMGTSVGELEFEKPAHQVTLSAYCIDATEVTAGRYAECVTAGTCSKVSASNAWPGITGHDRKTFDALCNGRDKHQRGDHPMNCVDWSHADAYCAFRGARLPTEAEWEHAARGDEGRNFPWGDDDPSPKLLNACGKECETWSHGHGVEQDTMFDADDGWATTAPVGSFPLGDTERGVHDLAGNVWEWTSDWYGDYSANASRDPKGPSSGEERVIRGGAWNGAYPQWVSAMFRYKNTPSTRSYGVGFRCAKTL